MGSAEDVPSHTIDRTPEYEKFINDLREYHDKRGTTLDPEPKISTTPLDLLKLFKIVVEKGGYDAIHQKQMGWREIREELNIPTTNPPSAAYSLKEKYYKNLAAYEISTIHKQEPPPKDILEDVTAKGADLLTRTRENFLGAKHRSTNGDESAGSGDEGTPSRDRANATNTTPLGSSARASRGLREAPAQRVIFQPDTAPSRTRHMSSGAAHQSPSTPSAQPHPHGHAPSPSGHPNTAPHLGPQQSHTPVPLPFQARPQRGPSSSFKPENSKNIAPALDNWQPQSYNAHPHPLTLNPVVTPANNPVEFARRKDMARRAILPAELPVGTPGFGHKGPGIYHQCLMALKSGIHEQQAFALFHLVRISYERGDKFIFQHFAGLAESLIQKILEVGSLFYDVNWEIYWNDVPDKAGALDGRLGTPDILERIDLLPCKSFGDEIMPGDASDKLFLIKEAALTLRNMCFLPDNGKYLASMPYLRDMICIVLSLPDKDCVVELKHLMLEVSEELTRYIELDHPDPFYRVLMAQLDSPDWGKNVASLRGLARISTVLDESINKLSKVPPKALESIINWLYLKDDELMDACLDFLYQYTAVVSNVDNLFRAVAPEHLVFHLVRLLSYGGKRVTYTGVVVPGNMKGPMEEPSPMPEDLLEELLKLEEPDRCKQWVKCFFEQGTEKDVVTQIAAWQAYQRAFDAPVKKAGHALISPAEFIRISTDVYPESKAQVQQAVGPETQGRFVIGGLRVREYPVSIDETPYRRCKWKGKAANQNCGVLVAGVHGMAKHVLEKHLDISPNDDGQWPNHEVEFTCHWEGCPKRGKGQDKQRVSAVAKHLITQAAQIYPRADAPTLPNPNLLKPPVYKTRTFEQTPVEADESNPHGPVQAAGVPVSAALILRNIARNAPKTQMEEDLRKSEGSKFESLNQRLFSLLRPRLFRVMTENSAMAEYISSIILLVDAPREADDS